MTSDAGFVTALARFAGTHPPASIVSHVADVVRGHLGADRVLVVLDRPNGAEEPPLVHEERWPEPHAADPLAAAVRAGGAARFRTRDPASAVADDGAAATPWIGVPLRAAHRTVGVVCAGRTLPFDPTDLARLEAIAAPAALALVNARLMHLLSLARRDWEQTVDAIPQAFCIVGPRGAIRRGNRAFASLVGAAAAALEGRPWHELFPREATEIIARALATAGSRSGQDLRIEQRQFTATAHPMGPTDEQTTLLILEDQTDKRALQEQVIQSAKMSAIGQLIAGIAHDLNNPLASVVGFSEYLAEARASTPPSLVEPLRAIHEEAERASKIVRSLLAFARKQEGDRGPLEIGPVLHSTHLLFKNQFIGYQVEATLTVPRDLPTVEGNANQLQQVFVNILTNAVQAIHATGRPGTIAIAAEPWLDGVAVVIEDDGPGISPEIADRIFEPFFTTKPEGEGTGLGLSICHGIVTEHGGRIQHLPRRGSGAIFRVELPGGAHAQGGDPPPPDAPGMLRILIVDDEPHILHYMRAALEDWGHTVQVAPDGREGLRVVRSNEYDVVITDLRMPGVGGRELYETLRADRPDLAERVVFCTGDTVGGEALAFLEAAGRPHLTKPFTLAELRSILPPAAAPSGS